MTTSHISPVVLKSLIATGVVYLIDNKVLQSGDMTSSMWFAAASGVGIYGGSMFGATVAGYIPNVPSSMLQITERLTEVGLGAATSLALNRYVLKNAEYNTSMGRLGAIIAADITSTLIVEYLNGQPLVIL